MGPLKKRKCAYARTLLAISQEWAIKSHVGRVGREGRLFISLYKFQEYLDYLKEILIPELGVESVDPDREYDRWYIAHERRREGEDYTHALYISGDIKPPDIQVRF